MKDSDFSIVKIHFSLGLVSASLIAFQIVLIQLLSVMQWHHFAYMIISVAMLGFGSAGTVISLYKDKLIAKAHFLMPVLLFCSAASTAAVLFLINTDYFRFDTMLLFTGDYQFIKLAATYLIILIPFFFGAAFIGLIFVKFINDIGKLYFTNLAGSGAGGLLIILLMWYISPENLPAVVALTTLAAGLLLIKKSSGKSVITAAVGSVLIVLYALLFPAQLKVSEFKSISRVLNMQGAEMVSRVYSPYGLTEAVASDAIRYSPGLSLNYTGSISAGAAVFNNGDWAGPYINLPAGYNADHFLFSTTNQLPFLLTASEHVLVLNSGSGTEVLLAVLNNSVKVKAVEPNAALIDVLNNVAEHLSMANPYLPRLKTAYDDSSVEMKATAPYTYILSANEKYDLITMPAVDAFGGSSGLFSLQEQYHLTVEAFKGMYEMLKPGGMIAVSVYIDYPYRSPLKLIATIVEALKASGHVDVNQKIAAVKNWNLITLMIKSGHFSSAEIKLIREFCDRMSFDPVFLPDLKSDERDKYNKLQDENLYKMIDEIVYDDDKRENLYEKYDFNIRPANEDQPYFSQFLKWNSLSRLQETYGSKSLPFLETGYLILYVTFIQVLIAALVLIIIPLMRRSVRKSAGMSTFLYFSGIGIGYMFVEIFFIQKFILYFGNPVYSVSAVISLMLISSGAGSYVSHRLRAERRTFSIVLPVIIIALVLSALFLSGVIRETAGYHVTLKYIIAFLFISVPAFFMGMPFPLGLRAISISGSVPWAWGINGCFSVVSAVGASIIAVEKGFSSVMFLAAGAYIMTFVAVLISHNVSETSEA